MIIKLYKCFSENERVDKTDTIVEVKTMEGALRQENVTVVNPVITLQYSSEIFKCNYAYIPEFNRYYFINDFSNIVNNIVEISLHVDVLMSFKDEWLQNAGYVDTSLNYGNFYLNDQNTPVQQNTDLFVVKQFNSPFNGSSIIMNCLNTAHKVESTETEA